MAEIIQYKCPCCGGAIEFDSTLQKMKCPFCDTEFEMDTLKGYDEDLKEDGNDNLNWEAPSGASWQDGEEEGLLVYVCQSCGGEIIGDDNMAATSCPYCDNAIVIKNHFRGELKPDFVIPFKYDKKAAKEALKKHFKGKKLLPKVFSDENHLDEIKGVYVPFWLYEATAQAHMRYRATKVRRWSDSKYVHTETSYYSVVRGGSIGYDHVPVDGSTKMDDALMESLEPFDFKEAVDFQTAYLAGYLADKYDVSSEESMARANERIYKSTEQTMKETVRGYATVTPEGGNIQLSNGQVKYALYPVWILNTTWKDEKYVFAMNGQTGKFVGNLPTDKGAFRKWLWGLTGVIGVGIYILQLLAWFL